MTNLITPKLYIFVALECEARSVINHFGLKKQSTPYHFPIYSDDQVVLTVAGIGKVAMAGAVAYTLALFPAQDPPVIINLGIAGHKTAKLGCLLLAVKIIDHETNKNFYPQLAGDGWPEDCEVLTTSLPCLDYKDSLIYDMEASAFYETAIRFSSNELIHSIKIVSDNESSSIHNINSKRVTEWVTNQITEIDHLFTRWAFLRDSLSTPQINDYDEILNRWSFTVTGKIKLNALLLRWKVLSEESWLTINDSYHFRNGKELIRQLENDINSLVIHL